MINIYYNPDIRSTHTLYTTYEITLLNPKCH